jgi:hypothetical protein
MQDVLADRGQRLMQQPLRDGDLLTREIYVVLHPPIVDMRGLKAQGTQ